MNQKTRLRLAPFIAARKDRQGFVLTTCRNGDLRSQPESGFSRLVFLIRECQARERSQHLRLLVFAFLSLRWVGRRQEIERRARGAARTLQRMAVSFLLPALSLWWALSFISSPARAQATDFSPYEGKPIASVKVQSVSKNLSAPEEQLRDIIDIRQGEAFSLAKIRGAIRKLYTTGRASDVSVSASVAGAGVELTFTFTPQAKVASVAFLGTPVFPSDVLLSRVSTLDRGARITDRNLSLASSELAVFYRENGYYRATITPSVALDATGANGTVTMNVSPGDPTVVSEFRIEIRSQAISAAELLEHVTGKPGEVFSRTQLQQDVDAIKALLFSRGFLDAHVDDPAVQYDSSENEVAISITGAAGLIVNVEVSGYELSKKKERELLPILTDGGLEDYVLEDGRRKLYDYVQRQGYFFASVEYEVLRPGSDRATVEYKVDKNQRYRVREIRMQGTIHLTVDDVRAELRSTVGGPFRRGLTSREYLQRDSELIARKLAEQGYRRAAVRERRLGFKTGTEDLVVTFVVDEGALSRIASVDIAGNTEFPAEELKRSVAVKPNDPFSQVALNKGTESILAKYGAEGFVTTSVEIEAQELEPGSIAVTYNIHEGPRVSINRTVVFGNRVTRRSAINRYLSFRTGELLKLEDINRSEQDLYSTGAFKEVKITTEPVGQAESGPKRTEKHDVTVSVVEASTRQIVYGFGYQSDDGPRGIFEISSVNWLGTLTTLSFKTRDSRREQLSQVSWLNPRPARFRMPLLLSFLYQRQNEVSFDNTRLTALAQLERRFGASNLLFLRYNFEKVDIFDVRSSRDLFFNSENVKLGRLSATLIRDTRDNAFDPSKGAFSSIDASITARWLLGNAQFSRFFGEHQRFYRLPKTRNAVYATDLRIGLAVPYGSATSLPISERFFAGGATTLRGFAFQQAGPRDTLTIPATGEVIVDPKTGRPKTGPIGGNALIALNNELRFPIFNPIGGVLFSDTGNIFKTASAVRLDGMSQTIGFGLRVRTPLGPLRLDFGYLVTAPPPGFKRGQFHFSFGQAF